MDDHPHQLGHIGGTVITALLAVFPTLAICQSLIPMPAAYP